MMADQAKLTETIAVKQKHIAQLQDILQRWPTTTLTERREFGEYYTEEDIKVTLQQIGRAHV